MSESGGSESRMRKASPLLARKEMDRARRAAEAKAEPGAKNQVVNLSSVLYVVVVSRDEDGG